MIRTSVTDTSGTSIEHSYGKKNLLSIFEVSLAFLRKGKENENRVVYLWWDLNLNAADLKSTDILCTLKYLFIHSLTYHSLILLKQKISSIDLKWRIKKEFLLNLNCVGLFETMGWVEPKTKKWQKRKSKHLKGRLGPPVSHVTFFNQRRSVGAPRESRHVF